MQRQSRLLTSTVWVFYVAIVFEFLFMITPFALYFYSAFTPALQWLNRSPWTAWLTGFFLPHFSQTNSALLNGLSLLGWWLAYGGLGVFLVSAAQLYGAKLLRHGVVSGLFYRYVRHPQYLGLALLGMGVTLIWPRFLALAAFVTMLFLYRWLAALEEQRCDEKYGDAYRRYLASTGSFLPRIRRDGSAPRARRGDARRPWSEFLSYVLVLVVALAAAFALREHMLDRVSAQYRDDLIILSPAMLTDDELSRVYGIADNEPMLRALVAEASAPLLVYVVPAAWYLPDLPMSPHDEVRRRGGHSTPADFSRRDFRVLLMRVRSHAASPRKRDIMRKAHGSEPLLIIDIDLVGGVVVNVSRPPETVIWGEIAPPLM